MSTSTTRPVALRMTDAERERLLTHGGTARAAVTKLLDLADEHATCAAPPSAKRPTKRTPTVSTRQTGSTSTQQQSGKTYEVQVAGRTVLRTQSPQSAERKRKQEAERYPRRMVEVRELST